MISDSILWRRLDTPGHDACRLVQRSVGWRLEGTAVFQHEGVATCITYGVACDERWRTKHGEVHGWIGTHPIDFRIKRSSKGQWWVNDSPVSLGECLDLDLGFTPATNLFQLRRISLQIGQAADVPVAWMDISSGTLEMLHQRYERRSSEDYWYEAPRFDYFALLRVREVGFVEQYPDLWEAEPAPPRPAMQNEGI